MDYSVHLENAQQILFYCYRMVDFQGTVDALFLTNSTCAISFQGWHIPERWRTAQSLVSELREVP